MNSTLKFESICDRLSKMDRCCCHLTDFSGICEEYDANPRIMDNMFYGLLGMSGEEVLKHIAEGRMMFLE